MILAKGNSVTVLIGHRSCTLKDEMNKRPRHSFPLQPLPFPTSPQLQVSRTQEWFLQTPLAVAHTRLKQLMETTSAAVWANLHTRRSHSTVLVLVQLNKGLQRKLLKPWDDL